MAHKTAYERSTRRIQTDGVKHCITLYSASGIALWRHWNKKTEAIRRFFELSHVVWQECANDHDHSMIQMCETETGIEIQNGDGVSWRDVYYLNGTIPESMSYNQLVYMRQQQLKWIRPQIIACMLVTLHRKYGFGFDRCSLFYHQVQDIEAEFRNDPKRLRRACYDLTGIDVNDTVTQRGYKKSNENRGSEKDTA